MFVYVYCCLDADWVVGLFLVFLMFFKGKFLSYSKPLCYFVLLDRL